MNYFPIESLKNFAQAMSLRDVKGLPNERLPLLPTTEFKAKVEVTLTEVKVVSWLFPAELMNITRGKGLQPV